MSADHRPAQHDVLAPDDPTPPPELDLFGDLVGPIARQRDGAQNPAVRAAVPRRLANAAIVAAGTGVTGLLVGRAAQSVAGDKMAPWILGRASGICAYLLLVALVGFGLLLSHPARYRWRRPSAAARIRAHVSLAVFTAAFLVLHIVVLATDRYADVGWWGALLPMASGYRPLPVTLGVVATYSGVLAGITAALAGRWMARIWWPVHKVAAGCFVLALLHGVLSGADTPALVPLYAVTTAGLVVLAGSRYRAAARARRADQDGESR